MDSTVIFGDVFSYLGEEYVYFVESIEDGVIFAGKILDTETTRQLVSLEKSKQKKSQSVSSVPVFSFVVLTTDEFNKRAVLCASNIETVRKLSIPHASLDSDDRDKIRDEIENGPAPQRLKELLKILE